VRVRRTTIEVDVRGVAPHGCAQLAADVFVPEDCGPRPLLWVCVPGGGIDRGYFDLEVTGQGGAFSMARHLAAGGNLVVTVDPPGVGGSDAPDDGYTLTPHVVADILAAATAKLKKVLGRDGIAAAGLGRRTPSATVGLGHSAGALLVAVQQARHASYNALALLGFSASGLPGVLTEDELGYAGRPEALTAVIETLTRARFGDPLPRWSHDSAEGLEPDVLAAPIDAALAAASSRLLAVVGMAALVPGSVQPELDEIRVPVFAALGERDLAGTLDVLPAQLPSCGDLTLFLLEGAGHNHNVARGRRVLWNRVAAWAASVTRHEARGPRGRVGPSLADEAAP
jgi:pimeloyl-ACP methyl ester carboxylesterase